MRQVDHGLDERRGAWLLRTELSSRASAIGIGKYSTSWTALITSVFSNACQKIGSASSWLEVGQPDARRCARSPL